MTSSMRGKTRDFEKTGICPKGVIFEKSVIFEKVVIFENNPGFVHRWKKRVIFKKPGFVQGKIAGEKSFLGLIVDPEAGISLFRKHHVKTM